MYHWVLLFIMQSDNVCFSTGVLMLFTFYVTIGMTGFKPIILLFAFYLSYPLSPPLFLFFLSFGQSTTFMVIFYLPCLIVKQLI